MYETNKYTASATMSVSGSAPMIRMERTYMSRRRFGDLFDFIQAMCLPDLPQAGGVNIKITYLVKVTKGATDEPICGKVLRPRNWIDPEKRRPNSAARGYGGAWRKIRRRAWSRIHCVRNAGWNPRIRLTTSLPRRAAGPMMRPTCRRRVVSVIREKRH